MKPASRGREAGFVSQHAGTNGTYPPSRREREAGSRLLRRTCSVDSARVPSHDIGGDDFSPFTLVNVSC